MFHINEHLEANGQYFYRMSMGPSMSLRKVTREHLKTFCSTIDISKKNKEKLIKHIKGSFQIFIQY